MWPAVPDMYMSGFSCNAFEFLTLMVQVWESWAGVGMMMGEGRKLGCEVELGKADLKLELRQRKARACT